MTYDAENRLVEVKKDTWVIAAFVYDGNGRQVQATVNGVETLFIGGHYEVTGSTSLTTDSAGVKVSEMRYANQRGLCFGVK